MKTILFISTLIFIMTGCTGCINVTHDVQTTKHWEGHFYTVEEFQAATENITLGDDESIWVLSNKSLSRALKSMMK